MCITAGHVSEDFQLVLTSCYSYGVLLHAQHLKHTWFRCSHYLPGYQANAETSSCNYHFVTHIIDL